MIPLLARRALTRLRYGAPVVVDYRASRPAPTTSTVYCAVQPAPRDVVDRMTDGQTSESVITLLTYGELRGAAPDVYPDRVRVPSGLDVAAGDYEVAEVQWSAAFAGQPRHRMVQAVLVPPLVTP
jgi:hypothetical protein